MSHVMTKDGLHTLHNPTRPPGPCCPPALDPAIQLTCSACCHLRSAFAFTCTCKASALAFASTSEPGRLIRHRNSSTRFDTYSQVAPLALHLGSFRYAPHVLL
jgi:hypothetical protein